MFGAGWGGEEKGRGLRRFSEFCGKVHCPLACVAVATRLAVSGV